MRLLYQLAKRFVAGETLEAMLPIVQPLVAEGYAITADHLGESVRAPDEAEAATREYLLLLQALPQAGLEPNISIKLSQLGLAIDRTLARDHLKRIVAEAQRLGGYVCVDMEDSQYTSATLELVAEVHRQMPCVGTVIQSMMRRSSQDVAALCREHIPVRLVKGAYKEPEDLAYPRREDICAQFRVLTEQLLRAGNVLAIGTHDEALVEATIVIAERLGRARDAFEFQFLYGIRRDLQRRLRDEGWRVRIYIPYGNAWAQYFYRRLRERKENVWFVVKNLFHQ